MNERRYQILWLHRHTVIDLIHGAVRITNLPHDCRVEAMRDDIHRDSIGLRLHSKEFDICPAVPGAEIRTFNAEFQSVGESMITAEHRYANDARFHALVHTIIGVPIKDIRQAMMIIEQIGVVRAPKSADLLTLERLERDWRDITKQREIEQASFKAITGQDMPMPSAIVEGESVKVGPSPKWSSGRIMEQAFRDANPKKHQEAIDPLSVQHPMTFDGLQLFESCGVMFATFTDAGGPVDADGNPVAAQAFLDEKHRGRKEAIGPVIERGNVHVAPQQFWCSGCMAWRDVEDAATLERALELRQNGKMLCKDCDADQPKILDARGSQGGGD